MKNRFYYVQKSVCQYTSSSARVSKESSDLTRAEGNSATAVKGWVSKKARNGEPRGGVINDTKYNNIPTLRGSDLPTAGGNPEPEELPTLNAVPEVMRTTARYLLMRTGRKCLEWFEIPPIEFLSSCHKPGRVQKEIDRACEIFRKKGRRLITLSFRYIAACLKKQQTFTPWARSAKKPIPKVAAYETWMDKNCNLIAKGVEAAKSTWEVKYGALITGDARA